LLLYPLVWISTQLETRLHVSSDVQKLGEEDLRHWMLQPAMLASEQLLLVARKGA
jgi:hypothetical protein